MGVVHPGILDFDRLLERTSVLLVDFGASWCSPSLLLDPVIEEVAASYEPEKVTVAQVDVDVERALAEKYQVVSIPTVLLFKDGKLIDKRVGAASRQNYQELLNAALYPE